MSRSRKKIKIYKDSKTIKDYNSRHRAAVKCELEKQLKTLDPDEIGTLPLNSEITNQYDLCDWKMFTDDEKALRK